MLHYNFEFIVLKFELMFNQQKLKIWCYLNHINYPSWFEKRTKLWFTNHENILQCSRSGPCKFVCDL